MLWILRISGCSASEMENRLAGWKRELLRAHSLIAGLFARSEARGRSLAYLQGLLSGCERKNGWQMAEWMGEASPYAMQHLLDRARWDADAARDRVREYVVEALGSPDAVLIVDETGFVKKGLHSAGVKRQYSGTAGRIENSQVGVFLGYASDKGAALVDRALYVPQEWAEDRERCRAAGIPDTVEFATKPELARQMIGRALQAGAACSWVAADEVYGADSKVRRMLEARQRRKKLSLAACASAYPKCAICSPVCRGTANTACSTSSPGPTGVGPTNSWPSSTTTENANLPCLIAFGSSYLIDIYNCSTMCILVVRETLH